MLDADRIVEQYIVTVKPKYMRVFIARSDPALNYGLLCAVLLSKIAFSKLKLLEEKIVPARRARKLHIGLFGYSRRVGAISLPRAIPFAAALYSLGIPPEVLGGRVLAELSDGEWKLMEKNYVNLRHDLNAVAGYLSWRNIEMIDALCNSISEKVSMSKENLKKVLKEVLSDIKAIEETLGISFGPRKLSERKHENHVNNFLISFLEGDNVGASMSLLEAAKIRKCLG